MTAAGVFLAVVVLLAITARVAYLRGRDSAFQEALRNHDRHERDLQRTLAARHMDEAATGVARGDR